MYALTLFGKDTKATGFAALMAKGSRERIEALFPNRISKLCFTVKE